MSKTFLRLTFTKNIFDIVVDSPLKPHILNPYLYTFIQNSGENHIQCLYLIVDLNNYRGISLQNCMTKLFSAVLNDRLI